jgi:hypothetical protein
LQARGLISAQVERQLFLRVSIFDIWFRATPAKDQQEQ